MNVFLQVKLNVFIDENVTTTVVSTNGSWGPKLVFGSSVKKITIYNIYNIFSYSYNPAPGSALPLAAVLAITVNQSVPLACGVGHSSELEHVTGLGCWPYKGQIGPYTSFSTGPR